MHVDEEEVLGFISSSFNDVVLDEPETSEIFYFKPEARIRFEDMDIPYTIAVFNHDYDIGCGQ